MNLVLPILLIAACTDDPAVLMHVVNAEAVVEAEPSTVVTVTWETTEAASGYVVFNEVGGREWTTPPTEVGTEHTVQLRGMPTDTDVEMRIVSGGDTFTLDPVTTGPLPIALPAFEASGTLTGNFVLLCIVGDTKASVIIDGQGRIVWWYQADTPSYRSRIRADRTAVLRVGLHDDDTENTLDSLPFAIGERESLPFSGLGHDFLELPDGTIAGIASDTRTVEGAELVGNKLVELQPDGSQSVIWSAFDTFVPDIAAITAAGGLDDWNHANALKYYPAEDAYYINLHRMDALVKVDRSTGAAEWVLGGDDNEFTYIGEVDLGLRHQFDVSGDSLWLFQNDRPEVGSSVRRYRLDQAARTLELEYVYSPDPPIHTFTFGETIVLEGGIIHTNWGSGGVMRQITETGETTWLLQTAVGAPFGYSSVLDSLY